MDQIQKNHSTHSTTINNGGKIAVSLRIDRDLLARCRAVAERLDVSLNCLLAHAVRRFADEAERRQDAMAILSLLSPSPPQPPQPQPQLQEEQTTTMVLPTAPILWQARLLSSGSEICSTIIRGGEERPDEEIQNWAARMTELISPDGSGEYEVEVERL